MRWAILELLALHIFLGNTFFYNCYRFIDIRIAHIEVRSKTDTFLSTA